MELDLFLKFGLSLAVGVFIGLQREYAAEEPNRELATGIRSFALLSLLGCAGALITVHLGSPLPLIAVFVVAGLLILGTSAAEAWRGDLGLTTEFSALLTIALGALICLGYTAVVIAAAVAVSALLSFKLEIHAFVRRLTRTDIIAALKFAVITAIVLPVLPNRKFGPEPFNLFNPYTLWLLVVLISGLSFVGYVLIKIIGRRGITPAGVLGGMISSTAVTLSMTQRSKSAPQLSPSWARAVILAWTIMYLRVMVISGFVYPSLLRHLAPAMAASAVAGIGYTLFLHFAAKRDAETEGLSFVNPFELGPAIKFAVLFTAVLFIAKAANIYFGDAGVYAAAVLTGLADVDAITLSAANLAESAALPLHSAARAIILACTSNTLLKTVVVLVGGSPQMRKSILPGSIMMIVVALLFVLFT